MELILMGFLMHRTIKNEEEAEVKEEEEEEVFSIARQIFWNKDTIQPQYSFHIALHKFTMQHPCVQPSLHG
jgi:hypothetical protein